MYLRWKKDELHAYFSPSLFGMILDASLLTLSGTSSSSSSSSSSILSPSSSSLSSSSSPSPSPSSSALSSTITVNDNLKHFSDLQSMTELDGESSTISLQPQPQPQAFSPSNKEECEDLTVSLPIGNENVCYGCGFEIKDRYMMKIDDHCWHENCLICYSCRIPLNTPTCYLRNGQLYCKQDYMVLFGAKCMRCNLPVQITDYVYRVFVSVYHAQCFTCFCCGHLFKKGDHYMLVDGQVICRPDYEHLLYQAPICQSHLYYDQSDLNRKTTKRPRTILNTQQRKAFKQAFEKTSKPCRKVREQLAKETNLSVRVVQVWFQNQRAKMKKIQRKQEVSQANGATCSETDAKSNDDSKSNCDSADEMDSENEDVEIDDAGSGEEKMKESNNPIAQLFHMHATYFLA